MKKTLISRRSAVEKLIRTHAIEDQETLIRLLQEEYDIETNQSAVSRDLRDLGVRKAVIDGNHIYELATDTEHEILRLAVIDIVHNESLLIVKTVAGLAAFVGDFIDRQDQTNMLGTISGENMVFVSPKSVSNMKQNYDELCEILEFKQPIS